MSFIFFKRAATSVPNAPSSSQLTIFLDLADGVLKSKDSAGTVTAITGAQLATLMTAGAGMSGGGDLSASRTFNVGANADGSITVNADDIQVGVLATDAQHGTRGGGTLHANAVANGAAGFITGANQAKLDSLPAAKISYNAVDDFGFVGNLVSVGETTAAGTSVVMTSGSPTITLTQQAPFTSTLVDAGKTIIVEGAGASGAPLRTTILTVTSASVATLAANAGTTVTASTTVEINVSFGTMNTIAGAIAAMTTAVNTTAATFPGLKIRFPQSATNAYWFEGPVVFNKPCQIEGVSGGYLADSGNGTRVGGTRLAWGATTQDGGTPFGAFFTWATTGVQALKRVSMRSCWLDCRNNNQNQALFGLKLTSCHGFMLEDFFIMDPQAGGIWADVSTTPVGDAADTTRFSIRDVCIRTLDNGTIAALAPMTTPVLMTSAVVLTTTPQNLTAAANTLPAAGGYFWTATTAGFPVLVRYTSTSGGGTTINNCTVATEFVVHTPTTVNTGNIVQATPGNACAMLLNGGAAHNTCCGLLEMVQIQHGTTWGPAAMEFCNTDSIVCMQVMIFGGNGAATNAVNRITKPGIRQNGSIVAGAPGGLLASRNNHFISGDPGAGGISCMGSDNTGARLNNMSGPTYWDLMQMGNGAPLPTVENRCALDWTPNGGLRDGSRGGVSVADQAIANTNTLITGSVFPVPPQGFQVGTTVRWTMTGIHTAAAGGTAVVTVRIGATGTIADATTPLTCTFAAGTVATATHFKIVVEWTVRTLGAAATSIGQAILSKASALGMGGSLSVNIPTPTVSTFNSTTAQQFVSLGFISGAAGTTATFQQCYCEVVNPSNP